MKSVVSWIAVGAIVLFAAACGSSPTIESFSADKTSLPYGQTVKLTWSVKDAKTVSINGVTVNGTSATDNPTQTTSYTLTATNDHGAVSSPPVTVTVTAGMSVSGGTYNSGSLGTTYLVRLRDDHGQPQGSDTTITVTPPTGSGQSAFTLNCTANQSVCFFLGDKLPPQSGNYTASATLGGQQLSASFAIDSGNELDPAHITASANSAGTAVDASWAGVTGAQMYVAQAFNLDTGNPISDPVDTTQTQASLSLTGSLTPDGNYGVAVSSFAVNPFDPNPPAQLPIPNASRALGYLSNVPGSHWTFYGPSDYSGGQLTINIPNLDPTEHLAIIALNLGTSDVDPTNPTSNATLHISGVSPYVAPAAFTVSSSGTSSTSTLAPTALMASGNGPDGDPAMSLALRAKALSAHELIRSREAQVLADQIRMEKQGVKFGPSASVAKSLVTAAATNTTFCVQQGISAGAPHVRKSATLKKETAHALFYLDDDDASEYLPYETGTSTDIWNQLGTLWENTIYPDDTQTFGSESDIDKNGKLIIFVSKELGGLTNGSIVMGYYWAGDVVYTKDTSANCTGSGSNAADMFYLNSLGNLQSAGYQDTQVISTDYPDTLGHEFQHLINYNQKHIVRTGTLAEDTWINEGLSMAAEDIIGFGWNTAGGRSDGNALLTDQPLSGNNPYLRYFNASLTNWQGDPVGNYQGAHAFMRYFGDRMGASMYKSLVDTASVGTSNLSQVLGEPFDRAFGEWTTAVMFSNEVFSPASRFDYTGTNWDPLHLKLQASNSCTYAFPYPNRPGYLEYETFSSGNAYAALRAGGWNAFVTGAGNGTPVTITVTPTVSGVQPNIVVVRFAGTLPDGRQTACK